MANCNRIIYAEFAQMLGLFSYCFSFCATYLPH